MDVRDADARVLLRMRDVLIVLAAAAQHRQTLRKVQLQKFVYLVDALSTLFETVPVADGFQTFRMGPWDVKIQRAVDCLAFRGLVAMADVEEVTPGVFTVAYSLTPHGRALSDAIMRSRVAALRVEAATEIATHLDSLGWDRLRRLVYAEPAYVAARSESFGIELRPGEAFEQSTRELVELIELALQAGGGTRINRTSVVNVFFRFLDAYSRETDEDLTVPPNGGATRWL